jgi:hypothetical protein
MRTIWKLSVPVTDDFERSLPKGSEVLSAGLDAHGELCMWFLVPDTEAEQSVRRFHVVGTGNPLRVSWSKFLGTVAMPPFVWHIFEELGS